MIGIVGFEFDVTGALTPNCELDVTGSLTLICELSYVVG